MIEEFLRSQGDAHFAACCRRFVRRRSRAQQYLERTSARREYGAGQYEFQGDCPWRNSAAKQNAAAPKKQFQEEEKLGAMAKLDMVDAFQQFGERLGIAAPGAIPKTDDKFRVINNWLSFLPFHAFVSFFRDVFSSDLPR